MKKWRRSASLSPIAAPPAGTVLVTEVQTLGGTEAVWTFDTDVVVFGAGSLLGLSISGNEPISIAEEFGNSVRCGYAVPVGDEEPWFVSAQPETLAFDGGVTLLIGQSGTTTA